jgi:uncharacterized phage protein (TIGR02218 family)
MDNWYQAPLTTLAFCWRLARRDGIVLGFTSHDRDLALDGLIYRATPGMIPSAIEKSASLTPDTVSLSGVLTVGAITAADLEAGRWDGAKLWLTAVNWETPDDAPITLLRGTLGAVSIKGEAFEVELMGPTAALDAPLTEATSPECRASLGDKRCRVDLAGRRMIARVTVTDDTVLTLDQPLAAGAFAQGRLQWLDGPNAGAQTLILANDGGTITLAESPPVAPVAGNRVRITQGCDRRFTTCVGRFANAANFRGEPHLPGNDLLLRYASG